MSWLKTNLGALIILTAVAAVFFYPVWRHNKLPLPTDTIVGLYHPYRDFLASKFPNGVPYKNFLTTDPVRQQFLWKKLAIVQLKAGKIPWWNPYTHSGTPLLANMQAGVFYPLNFIFFISSFTNAWTIFILLQTLLGSFFMYSFLRHKKLTQVASILGSISFVFSGFFIAWLEWGNIGHTILWLPLLFLSIDKIFKNKRKVWRLIFVFSLVSQFLAGHLQTSFYVMLAVVFYILWKLRSVSNLTRKKTIKFFVVSFLAFLILTSIQWLPTLEFISLSARDIDQSQILTRSDWFLPWQHLGQLVAPDFFGNPATLNYWGVWNYGEFVSFIGLIPLILALASLFAWKRGSRFFSGLFLLSLLFALPNPISKIPFLINIPLISQAQPSRLLFLTTFSLSVLAAFGFDHFIKSVKLERSQKLALTTVAISIIFLWITTFTVVAAVNSQVSQRNLVLSTAMLLGFSLIIIAKWTLTKRKIINKKALTFIIPISLLLLSFTDNLRFATKFTPFSSREYLFPRTKIISTLLEDEDIFRVMSTDRRILPPNFTMAYGIQTIEGYDPLYLFKYAQLITQLETGEKRDKPIGFNRIITPGNIDSEIINKLNVKYILSLTDLDGQKLQLVDQEGETRLYINSASLSRARLLGGVGTAEIVDYQPNKVQINVSTVEPNILELADMMYPGWQATLDGQKVSINQSEENFRLVDIPAGSHQIIFYYQKFKAG